MAAIRDAEAVYSNEISKSKGSKSDVKSICDYALINEVPIHNALMDVKANVYNYLVCSIIVYNIVHPSRTKYVAKRL